MLWSAKRVSIAFEDSFDLVYLGCAFAAGSHRAGVVEIWLAAVNVSLVGNEELTLNKFTARRLPSLLSNLSRARVASTVTFEQWANAAEPQSINA